MAHAANCPGGARPSVVLRSAVSSSQLRCSIWLRRFAGYYCQSVAQRCNSLYENSSYEFGKEGAMEKFEAYIIASNFLESFSLIFIFNLLRYVKPNFNRRSNCRSQTNF